MRRRGWRSSGCLIVLVAWLGSMGCMAPRTVNGDAAQAIGRFDEELVDAKIQAAVTTAIETAVSASVVDRSRDERVGRDQTNNFDPTALRMTQWVQIVGIVAGAAVMLALIASLYWYMRKRCRQHGT